jgi:hypothetical protein
METMRSLLAAILLVAALMPADAVAEPAVVRTFEAKIYSTASTGGWVVGELREGATISVSEEAINGFRRVRLKDDSIGYVEERSLTLSNAAGTTGGAVIAGGAATSAPAQTPVPPPVPESTARRHKGFFLRLDGGFGYGSSSATQAGWSASISGASSQFGVAVGGAVAENVILAGDVWGGVLFSPSVTINGRTGTLSASASLVGFGPQFTYYFMPPNVYLSLTPAITVVSLTYNGSSANTKAGFGTKIAVGKEWWVGAQWGLGIAGQFLMSFNVDEGTTPPTWSTFGGGVSFSATYN